MATDSAARSQQIAQFSPWTAAASKRIMSESSQQGAQPAQLLSASAAVALIVGIVIGAGIFKTPALVAGISGDAGWALAIWVAGALISMAGALCYAELCTAYPHAGGDYH
ncbi:MAG: amino acid permease, partial [Limnohabitans sp.]